MYHTLTKLESYWYEPILPSESTFPISCQKVLIEFVSAISSHLYRKRTADTFLEFLTNSSSMVIVFLNELCAAFEAAGPAATAEDAVQRYLESNPESSLSSLLAHQQQEEKIKTISDDILSRFLDSGAYDCIPVRNFLREVLSGIVLESTISNMSRPEFINGWITYLFSEGESEIMSAIDAGVEGARNHGVTGAKVSGEISETHSRSTDVGVAEPVSPSRSPGSILNKVDQATEEALLEAKRLSDMIAAQNMPNNTEQVTQDNTQEADDSTHNCDTLPDAGMGSCAGPRSNEGTPPESELIEGIQKVQELSSSEVSSSITSPPGQSPGLPTSSTSDSFDIPPASILHCASITVDNSFETGDTAVLRSKPTSDYLIQVEPHSGRSSGWMVFKKYADFESIHETLGTIARLNQLRFGDTHPLIPSWKGQTRQALAHDLERYLHDALRLEPLAESVTMRRFLEKDGRVGANTTGPSVKPGFAFPGQTAFENVGKGVLGVLTNAPKGVSGGSKAVLEGVTGVFGGGPNKKTQAGPGVGGDSKRCRDSLQKSAAPLDGGISTGRGDLRVSNDTAIGALSTQPQRSGDTSDPNTPIEIAHLTEPLNTLVPTRTSQENAVGGLGGRVSPAAASVHKSSLAASSAGLTEENNYNRDVVPTENRKSTEIAAARKRQGSPISADETRMAVELIFAVINELYSLSSAWNIRRTLLNAAKSYILRPGNPSLETIRGLLQGSMIDSHTTDEAVGVYLTKLRENALPTAEELSTWPPAMSNSDRERQREAARRILVQKGLPQAITSVMGAVASREALGKVFDSLQIEVVARGFIFSILLQALRAVVL